MHGAPWTRGARAALRTGQQASLGDLVLVSACDSAVTCSFRSGKKKRESGLCNSIIIDVFELRHDTSCIKVLCWLFAFLQLIGCLHCLPIALALHRCFLIRTACALTAAWSEGNEDFAHTHGTCNLVEKKNLTPLWNRFDNYCSQSNIR